MAHREESRRYKKDSIAEFLNIVQEVDLMHPENDEELMFFRRYRIAYYVRPDGCVPCHICQAANPLNTPRYFKDNKIAGHCSREHVKAKITCEHNNCTVHFTSMEDKEKHMLYVHTKPYGWWIPA